MTTITKIIFRRDWIACVAALLSVFFATSCSRHIPVALPEGYSLQRSNSQDIKISWPAHPPLKGPQATKGKLEKYGVNKDLIYGVVSLKDPRANASEFIRDENGEIKTEGFVIESKDGKIEYMSVEVLRHELDGKGKDIFDSMDSTELSSLF